MPSSFFLNLHLFLVILKVEDGVEAATSFAKNVSSLFFFYILLYILQSTQFHTANKSIQI
jgi:hypothetical protein